jgi:hypothetical protein
MHLPPELEWNVRRGDEDPPCGWYSPSFGTKTPSATLVGFGHLVPPGVELRTTLELDDACD